MSPYQLPNPSRTVQATAHPDAVVTAPRVRFTVLTSRLLRLEHSPQDSFEDRPSQILWHRAQEVPEFVVIRSPERIEIATEHLHLRYAIGPQGFTRTTLSIEVKSAGTTWRYGDRDRRNLRGTARTLDGADGPVRLGPGLMSRAGWAVVDDSTTLVFDAGGWLQPRSAPANADLYFFGYGHDYLACLRDFCRLSGPIPLIPRWALGNWWSRYWPYSQDELTALMADFRAHDVPLSVCVIDMDWHITSTGNAASGWTGYTWNRKLLPDPEGFLRELHAQGLKATLNLHPADGVYPHEEQYAAMAERLGVDPASGEPVPFDPGSRRFAEAYFEVLHHPLEAQGVDFWWIDWQQGENSGVTGLDPLWWLNHLHFYDLARDGRKRPFIFSRWGGLCSRYAIGFSGDSIVSWASLAFQPYFTATAANAAWPWWSHDIGGHMRGVEEPELYARWVQWGVFSPILRLHSTNNPYHERRPWGWDAETYRVTRDALQLRHRLIPYLYTMARRTHAESRPLILPMYYEHPDDEAAYECPSQYLFGSELIAAPFATPRDPDTRLSRQTVWLPAGDWYDFFTAEHFPPGWHAIYGGLDAIPVFARAGAIIPLAPAAGWGGLGIPNELDIHVFAGADRTFALYEDDGESLAFESGQFCVTAFHQAWHGDRLEFRVARAEGTAHLAPAERRYRLIFHGVREPDAVRLAVSGSEQRPQLAYDEPSERLTVEALALPPADELVLSLETQAGTLLSRRDRRPDNCRRLLRAFRLDTAVKERIDRDLRAILADPARLMRHARGLSDAHLQALAETARRR